MRRVLSFLPRLVHCATLISALAYLGAVVALMCVRVPYPFELEWMEGAMVDHVRRLFSGEPLYVAPTLDFTPFLYPPGFYAVSAALSWIVGGGFLPLRLVSALSSVGTLILIGLFVTRETRRRDLGVVAAGLFAACFQVGGSWFDVGRVDMLLLFLLFGAFFAIRYGRQASTFVLAGLLLSAAFLTKQSAAVMALPVMLWLVVTKPAAGTLTALVAGTVGGGTTLWLDQLHDGWYRYYVFQLPAGYPLDEWKLLHFWTEDLLPMAVAGGLGLLTLLSPGDARSRAFFASMAIGLVGGAWLSRGNPGGWLNVLLPAFAALSVLAGIGASALRRIVERAEVPAATQTWPGLLVLVQFGVLIYNPLQQLPPPRSADAGHALVQMLNGARGAVWVPDHGYLAPLAGKPAHAHWMAVADILTNGSENLRANLRLEVEAAIREQRFSMIVVGTLPFADFPSLDGSYELRSAALPDESSFGPLTGHFRRPQWIYVPRQAVGTTRTSFEPQPADQRTSHGAGTT
jgi:4-amino-4-deoxy-L-arabinose transferase-like glycosyltransferase